MFESDKGLRIHMAKHTRDDFYTIVNAFEYIKGEGLLLPSERQILMKALFANTPEDAIKVLMSTNSEHLKSVAEAIKWSPKIFHDLQVLELGVRTNESTYIL